MEKVIVNLIKLQNQFRILHWQTDSYAQHKAFGKAYEGLGELIDNLVEVHQGKYGKITYSTPLSIELVNLEEFDVDDVLIEVTDYLSTKFNEMVDTTKDTDCMNIRDSILQELNQLKYLLTLK
jgi:DNA-binding ferritin-like protein